MVASIKNTTFRGVRISQLPPPPPVLLGPSTFRMYTSIQTLTYLAAYQTAVGTIDQYYDTASAFDPGNVAPSFELSNSDTQVSFYAGEEGAARSIYAIVDEYDNLYDKCAFEVVVGGGNLEIGITNSFGDPAVVNGGATTYITYKPSGVISGDYNGAYGPYSAASFTEGDIIGVVQSIPDSGYGDSYFWFFKNGVLQHSTGQLLSFYAGIAIVTQP